MKRFVLLALVMSLLVSGCSVVNPSKQTKYTATFLNAFDTVTTVVGYGETEEEFQQKADQVRDELLYYHQLFDIYNEYEGIQNLKTVNDQAGVGPVVVDAVIIELLQDCKTYYELTDHRVNVAMGSVLQLWHEARNAGIKDPSGAALPDEQALKEAAHHMDLDHVILDEEASTVYIADAEVQLDVGAIAKGWATQRVAESAPEGMLISVGGNVCATGPKPDNDGSWVIGIQDPDANDQNLHTIYVNQESVVTSGDYQRTYTVDGKSYHHIIDPDTQMPAAYWRAVTIVSDDSGLADALSTALFLMPLDEGMALAQECGVEAFWVDADGSEYMTPGFQKIIRT